MKSIYLHVFYLTIIAFLGYNYWSSVQAFKAFEHLDKQLKTDYGIMDNIASEIFRDIRKNTSAYQSPQNQLYHALSERTMKKSHDLTNFIDSAKTHVVNSKPFTDNQIKEKLTQFSGDATNPINDKTDRDNLLQQFNLPKLLADNAYWQLIKTLPTSGILAELSFIQNKIKTDEITLLNYYFNITSSTDVCGWTVYRAAIAPKKAALIEGETFEADVFIASYSNNLGSNVIIKVNGEPLEIKEGVAHFKSKNQTIGTKTIKAEAIIRNPLTGQTTTTEGSFEYQVLPKCSRDCQ